MNNADIEKRIEDIFEELRIANETIPIIVEGLKDEAALRKIGISGNIFRINTGQSLLDFCEEISRVHSEVILLPDWDNKGRLLFKRLKKHFKPAKIKTNSKFWRSFIKYCSREIQEVEQLVKYIIK